MIVRLVKMTFRPEATQDFEALFNERHQLIAGFDGCKGVELLREDSSDETGCVYFTRSIWIDEGSLQNYRHSELFKDTWKHTKALFADKPAAWTTKIVTAKFEDY